VESEATRGVSPDLETIHAVAHGEPVPDATQTAPVAEPAPAPVPAPPDRDADVAAALHAVVAELSRIKAAYGEDTARIVAERALITVRRS